MPDLAFNDFIIQVENGSGIQKDAAKLKKLLEAPIEPAKPDNGKAATSSR